MIYKKTLLTNQFLEYFGNSISLRVFRYFTFPKLLCIQYIVFMLHIIALLALFSSAYTIKRSALLRYIQAYLRNVRLSQQHILL